MPSPFLERQPADPHAELEFCTACGSFFWTDLGHYCPAEDNDSGFWLRLLGLIVVCVLAWLLVAWGVVTLRTGWFG